MQHLPAARVAGAHRGQKTAEASVQLGPQTCPKQYWPLCFIPTYILAVIPKYKVQALRPISHCFGYVGGSGTTLKAADFAQVARLPQGQGSYTRKQHLEPKKYVEKWPSSITKTMLVVAYLKILYRALKSEPTRAGFGSQRYTFGVQAWVQARFSLVLNVRLHTHKKRFW